MLFNYTENKYFYSKFNNSLRQMILEVLKIYIKINLAKTFIESFKFS